MAIIPVSGMKVEHKPETKEDQSPVLNSLVTPAILIKRHSVFSFNKMNYNSYYEAPPSTKQLDPMEMTFLQKGHVYDFYDYGEGVKVVSKLRIADYETEALLNGIPVKNPNATLVAKFQEKAHCIAALTYEWILEDYSLAKEFKRRVEENNGKVASHLTSKKPSSEVIDEGLQVIEDAQEFLTALPLFVTAFSHKMATAVQEQKEITALLGELKTAIAGLTSVLASKGVIKGVLATIDGYVKSGALSSGSTEVIDLKGRGSAVLSLIESSKESANLISSYEKSLEESLTMIHLGTPKATQLLLSDELKRMSAAFPALAHMHVQGDSVVYMNKEFTIRFQPDGVFIQGDPSKSINKLKVAMTDDGMAGDL